MLTRTSVEGYLVACRAIRDADLTEAARRIAVPTLCVVGDEDGSTPVALVQEFASMIPAAKFEVISGAGHLPCIERPDALRALIDLMLRRYGMTASDQKREIRVGHGDAPERARKRARRSRQRGDDRVRSTLSDLHYRGRVGLGLVGAQLTRRERSLITIALLAALDHDEEVAMHVRATANTVATPEDVRDALLHVAVYAGVPAANRAFKIARTVYAEASDWKS